MEKEVTLSRAMIGFITPLAVILIMLFSGINIKLALAAGIAIEGIFGIYLGYKWSELEEAAMKGIGRVNQTVIVMMLIGILIGVWISAGSVQTMLYYGINIINPKFFLPITFIICVITSIVTGTSWGTAGTIGIALIGVAQGLGVPVPMAAGAIISGALVGDKLSPLSDTTLLVSAVTEVKLFDHIMSLLYVTLPVSVISIIIYTILGLRYGGVNINLESIQVLSDSLRGSCNIGILMLVPLLLVLFLSARKKPSIPVFSIGIVIGVIWAIVFQGQDLNSIVKASINGFVSNTGNADIDKLLSRGGLMSMADTIFLCIGAGMFSGMFEKTGVLSTLLDSIRDFINSAGSLVLCVTATGALLMFGGAGQSCTLTLPAVAFKDAFDEFDLNSSILSRTLECSGTVLGSIVPWDASAILYTSLFGVSVAQYLRYNLVAILSPLAAIITVYLGYGLFKRNEQVNLKRLLILKK